MSKPVFVLLHGAWHSPRCWDRLVAALDNSGYTSVTPGLPTSSPTPVLPDWNRDIDTIRETVLKLAENDHNIVVVMHSFSGMTGGTALESLRKEYRAAKGMKGGVIRLVYIAAFIAPEGFQCTLPTVPGIKWCLG